MVYEELKTFMSLWGIPWCLRGDLNMIKLPLKRSTRGRSTSTTFEFLAFINLYNHFDPPLEVPSLLGPVLKRCVFYHILAGSSS